MLSIIRLRNNGVPLPEIRTMTSKVLREKIVLHTESGDLLASDKAKSMHQDIQQTFEKLEDLLDGDEE